MNIFKENYQGYIDKNISVIPDKYMSKAAGVKDYSKYGYQLPSNEELKSWENIEKSNIAIMLGQASGIVALDIDEVRPEILDIIMPLMPDSPVTKVGTKGETRFFRFNGTEHNQGLKFGGEMVVEIISTNKKTTIPPSIHPSGETYKWKDKSLLDINKEELPLLPPNLFSVIEIKLKEKFPDLAKEGTTGGKLHSGRNDALVSLAAKLIKDQLTIEQSINKLLEEDKKLNDPPLFSDVNEFFHSEPRTNALNLYSNVLESVNRRRFRQSKEYEVPTATVVDLNGLADAIKEREGKSQGRVKQRKLNRGPSPARSVRTKCPCCNKLRRNN